MDETTEAAYNVLLSLADLDDEALNLLRTIAYGGVDAAELMERWEREHVTNLAGRIEGRVFEFPPGEWRAEPKTGFASPRQFPTEQAARAWIQAGGHYETPAVR